MCGWKAHIQQRGRERDGRCDVVDWRKNSDHKFGHFEDELEIVKRWIRFTRRRRGWIRFGVATWSFISMLLFWKESVPKGSKLLVYGDGQFFELSVPPHERWWWNLVLFIFLVLA